MILTRRFGGLRMHGVVTPPEEAERVREPEDARTAAEITDTTPDRAVEWDDQQRDDQQRPAA